MALCALTGANGQAQADTLAQMRARLPQQEVIYFVLPDRFANGDTANDKGGLQGDRLVTGFDPSSKAFYHGGDLKGLSPISTISSRWAPARCGLGRS
jgi:hypothetical protein